MPDISADVFISYSRIDTDFVNRLRAELEKNNYRAWVDRENLKGGQNWPDELEKAIQQCRVLLVVLSPESVTSKEVRKEFRYGQEIGKWVIPLYYRRCNVPMGLNDIQWIDFQGEFEQGLKELIIALNPIETAEPVVQKASTPPVQSPALFASNEKEPELVAPRPAPPRPEPELDDLYDAGVKTKSQGDLERTVVFWKQIVDRDPDYQGGTFKAQLDILLEKLRPARIQRLRERAEEVSKAGEWGQEISMWEALLKLEPGDPQAQRRIDLARKNQKYDWQYENAFRYFKEGSLPEARSVLEDLWLTVPYYGDPQQLAEKITMGVNVLSPADFDKDEEEKARKEKREAESREMTEKREAARREAEKISKTINGFVEFELDTIPVVIWLALLCLLGGIGSAVGMLVQSWYWSVGAVVALLILAYYGLGYRRAIQSPIAIGIAVIGCFFAFNMARYAATFPTTPQTTDVWFAGRHQFWDEGQMIFGLLVGVASGLIAALYLLFLEDADLSNVFGGGATFGGFWGLVLWFILGGIATYSGLGFGIGAGWYISLIGLVIGIVGGAGLGASIVVCAKAYDM